METCGPRLRPDEFELEHCCGGIRIASTLQILCKQFLKECFIPFAVLFAKFAENFSDSAVPRVRTQSAADVRTTSCQFKHVSCSSIRHGGATCSSPLHHVSQFLMYAHIHCRACGWAELKSAAHDSVELIYRRLLKEILRSVIS